MVACQIPLSVRVVARNVTPNLVLLMSFPETSDSDELRKCEPQHQFGLRYHRVGMGDLATRTAKVGSHSPSRLWLAESCVAIAK